MSDRVPGSSRATAGRVPAVSKSIVEKSLASSWISSCTWSVVISCMSGKCGMTTFITWTATSIRALRGSGSTPASAGSGNGSLLSQYGMVRNVGAAASRLCRWVVPVRGRPAMTSGGRSSMSWISGCRASRSVSNNRFFSHCSSWAWWLTIPGSLHGRDLLQRSEIHVETLAVVVVAEVVEAGVGGGLGVQYLGVERALGRHHRHHVADLLRLGAEAGLCEVVQVDDGCLGIGHGDLCYSELRNENRPWPTS